MKIPIIRGGSWFTTGERKLRKSFTILIYNQTQSEETKKIEHNLEFHFEHNECFTVKIVDNLGSVYSSDILPITIINEGLCEVSFYKRSCVDFEEIQSAVSAYFNNHVYYLAAEYYDKIEEHKRNAEINAL